MLIGTVEMSSYDASYNTDFKSQTKLFYTQCHVTFCESSNASLIKEKVENDIKCVTWF